ncbi:Uncharacterised protein [Vibrio cholerae]|nr:Uncharacterised protein [Vibrio cholerae]
MVSSSRTRVTIAPTWRDLKNMSGSPNRCCTSLSPSCMSIRLAVWAY